MSHSRRERENISHNGVSLQKEREKDKKRREQELAKQEEAVDEPIFSQPRKVTTSRQDSLTRNIKKTLGDPEALFREPNPNIWLGTSRSAQGPNTPASVQPQNDSKGFPASSQISNTLSSSSHTSPMKRGSGPGSSGGSGGRTQSMNMFSHSQMHKSREEALKQSFNQNRNSYNSFSSYSMKSGRQVASPNSASNQPSSFNSSHLPISNHQALSSDLLDSDRLLDIPARMSERDRVSSVDSDMLGGVENILKEMVDLPPSITEIKTPSINDNKFSYMKRKITGPESSLESSTADALDTGDASDVNSSEEDTEDEGEDESHTSWNLGDFRKESHIPCKPILSTDASSKSSSEDKNTVLSNSKSTGGEFRNTSPAVGKAVSSKITDDRFSPRCTVEHNQHQTQTRGRKEDKKQSSVQRSASSDRRSSSLHRGMESSDSRIPESLNQTDPMISHTWSNRGENHFSSRQSNSRHHDALGFSRHVSGRSQPLSPPYGSVQSSYKGSPTKGTRVSKARHVQNSPNLPDKQGKGLYDSSSKRSHVSKETISTTAATTKDRHSVGRKGPSPRLTGHGGYSNSNVSSAPCDSPRRSSDSEMSDDDDYTTEQKQNNNLPGSDADSSSNSDSESSSSSDSESDNDEVNSTKDDTGSENTKAQASSPSWNLDNIRENAEQSLPGQRSSIDSKVSVTGRPSQSSPLGVTSPTTIYQPNIDQHNRNTVPTNNDKTKMKALTKPNAKKTGRQSDPGSMKPFSTKSPAASHRLGSSSKVSSVLHIATRNANVSTVEGTNQISSNVTKSRHNVSGNASPCGTKHQIANVRNNTVATEHVSKRGKISHQENMFFHKSLLVRIKASLLSSDAKPVPCATSYKSPPGSAPKRSQKLDHSTVSLATPPKVAKSPESSSTQHTIPQKRTLTTVSTGSETEQPIRRANRVEVAYADSRDWTDGSALVSKRRHNNFEQSYDEETRKRFKRDKGTKQTSPRSTAHSPWGSSQSLHKSSPNNQWRDQQNAEFSHQQNERQNKQNNHEYHNIRSHSNSQTRQESPTSNKSSVQHSNASSASFVLPDSSVPGEQESIQTSDWYMREGKRMKHKGDGIVDSRTGRTRPGEALNRALAYFEASLFFIMSGYVMESENREDRLESSSNSSSSANSPNKMYEQTLPLLNFVLLLRPHVEQDDRNFKRIMISCIRCQAFLYFRLFKLKKDMAMKYSELLSDQFKNVSKSNRTPSPWHHANSAPNVLSPMSPAVPSPFGHGPSPVSSNGEQVTSSTQAGKMTPPSHGSYSFPQKTYDIFRQHQTIMCNLLQAHEKWDQGESMLDGHTDFFRNIDTLCNRTLTFHTSLRDVFVYHKMVLHQLRTLTTNSPQE